MDVLTAGLDEFPFPSAADLVGSTLRKKISPQHALRNMN